MAIKLVIDTLVLDLSLAFLLLVQKTGVGLVLLLFGSFLDISDGQHVYSPFHALSFQPSREEPCEISCLRRPKVLGAYCRVGLPECQKKSHHPTYLTLEQMPHEEVVVHGLCDNLCYRLR